MKSIVYRVSSRIEQSVAPDLRATPAQTEVRRRVGVVLSVHEEEHPCEFGDLALNFEASDERHLPLQPGALFELRAL